MNASFLLLDRSIYILTTEIQVYAIEGIRQCKAFVNQNICCQQKFISAKKHQLDGKVHITLQYVKYYNYKKYVKTCKTILKVLRNDIKQQ